MATNKNITMKQFNGTDYDTLYPKTVAAQIPDVFSQSETVNAEMLSKYGLGANSTPNDVFGVLSRFQNGLGNEYVWAKGKVVDDYTVTELTTGNNYINYAYAPVYYADSFHVDISTGKFVLDNPQTLETCSVANFTSIRGKYMCSDGKNTTDTEIRKAGENSTITQSGSNYYASDLFIYKNPSKKFDAYSYVNSVSADAYPPAVSDGYEYVLLGSIGESLSSTVEYVSYVGTGTYGKSNPCSITFSRVPKYIEIVASKSGSSWSTYTESNNNYYYKTFAQIVKPFYSNDGRLGYYTDISYIKKSEDGKTFTWYSNSADYQLNSSGITYLVMGIF